MGSEFLVVLKRGYQYRAGTRIVPTDCTESFRRMVGGDFAISFSHPRMVNRRGYQLLIIYNEEREHGRKGIQNKLGFVGPIIICAERDGCYASLTAEDAEDVIRVLEGGTA